jgi:large subunit ribosomal protein L20
MVRVKSSVTSKRRKKKVLKQAKGQFSQRSKRFRQAKRSVIKSMQYAYRDRKNRKRAFRRLWIARIGAASREAGLSYSRFIKGLTTAKVAVNRKMLAELAVNSPDVFRKLVDQSKGAIGG